MITDCPLDGEAGGAEQDVSGEIEDVEDQWMSDFHFSTVQGDFKEIAGDPHLPSSHRDSFAALAGTPVPSQPAEGLSSLRLDADGGRRQTTYQDVVVHQAVCRVC